MPEDPVKPLLPAAIDHESVSSGNSSPVSGIGIAPVLAPQTNPPTAPHGLQIHPGTINNLTHP